MAKDFVWSAAHDPSRPSASRPSASLPRPKWGRPPGRLATRPLQLGCSRLQSQLPNRRTSLSESFRAIRRTVQSLTVQSRTIVGRVRSALILSFFSKMKVIIQLVKAVSCVSWFHICQVIA